MLWCFSVDCLPDSTIFLRPEIRIKNQKRREEKRKEEKKREKRREEKRREEKRKEEKRREKKSRMKKVLKLIGKSNVTQKPRM